MLNYIKTPITGGDYFTDDIFNDNSRGFVNALRVVDDLQLPTEQVLSQSLGTTQFITAFDTDRRGVHQLGQGMIGVSQSVFVVSGTITPLSGWNRNITELGGLPASINVFGPPTTSDAILGALTPFLSGTNNVSTPGTFARVDTREGMLHCEWTGDIEAPLIAARYTEDNLSVNFSVGTNWTFNVGLYVNGVLQAHTGTIPWGVRKLVHLDCSLPIGEQTTEVEIKYQAKVDRNDYRILSDQFTIEAQNDPVFNLFNSHLMIRNQYR